MVGTGSEEARGCLGEQLLPGGTGGSFSPGWTLSAREEMRCLLLIRETMTFGVSRHPHSTDSAYLHPFSHEVHHTFPVNSQCPNVNTIDPGSLWIKFVFNSATDRNRLGIAFTQTLAISAKS